MVLALHLRVQCVKEITNNPSRGMILMSQPQPPTAQPTIAQAIEDATNNMWARLTAWHQELDESRLPAARLTPDENAERKRLQGICADLFASVNNLAQVRDQTTSAVDADRWIQGLYSVVTDFEKQATALTQNVTNRLRPIADYSAWARRSRFWDNVWAFGLATFITFVFGCCFGGIVSAKGDAAQPGRMSPEVHNEASAVFWPLFLALVVFVWFTVFLVVRMIRSRKYYCPPEHAVPPVVAAPAATPVATPVAPTAPPVVNPVAAPAANPNVDNSTTVQLPRIQDPQGTPPPAYVSGGAPAGYVKKTP